MSAHFAVSVRKRSWTTVNRSSRARPFSIRRELGATVAGLLLKTNSERTGGSASSNSAPRRLVLRTRGCGLGLFSRNSGGQTTLSGQGQNPPVLKRMPPPLCP